MADLPSITPRIAKDSTQFKAFKRDIDTLAREWAFPGMAGFEHRIGGLEKNLTGSVSHDPENHQLNTEIREAKVQKVVDMVPDIEVFGENEGDVLVTGWGGTYGHLVSAVRELRGEGKKVSMAHFNYIKPLPANTEKVFRNFKKILVCELNMGQFASYLRDKIPGFRYDQCNKVKGLPFTVSEIKQGVYKLLEE